MEWGVSAAEGFGGVTVGCRSCCNCSAVPVVVTFGVHYPKSESFEEWGALCASYFA